MVGIRHSRPVRKVIRKMRQLEIQKKYTFGLDKTKYMVVETGTEKEEEIKENIERGMVEKANKYKYVGLWLNSEGDLKTHIEKKKTKSIMGEVNVGDLFICTRLFLYEACIIPSLLYQIEMWGSPSQERRIEAARVIGKGRSCVTCCISQKQHRIGECCMRPDYGL